MAEQHGVMGCCESDDVAVASGSQAFQRRLDGVRNHRFGTTSAQRRRWRPAADGEHEKETCCGA